MYSVCMNCNKYFEIVIVIDLATGLGIELATEFIPVQISAKLCADICTGINFEIEICTGIILSPRFVSVLI